MGKIFGISDLPVTTFMTPFEPIYKAPEKYGQKSFTNTTANQAQRNISGVKSSKPLQSLKRTITKVIKHK